eukprot:s920_g16.t1
MSWIHIKVEDRRELRLFHLRKWQLPACNVGLAERQPVLSTDLPVITEPEPWQEITTFALDLGEALGEHSYCLPKADSGGCAIMVAISIITISKELMLACRQLGHVVSEALAAVVAATVVSSAGGFFSEKPIDENDAKTVVEEAAKKILSKERCQIFATKKERPGISALRLQADYEVAFQDLEKANQKHLSDAKAAEEKTLAWISKFTAKFDEDSWQKLFSGPEGTRDFDTLTSLYKKIYHFLLLRCTSPSGEAKPPKDMAVEREAPWLPWLQ